MALPSPSPESAALVTGTSSGIGVEIARGLARRGHNLVLVARRADRLAELAGELSVAHGVRVESVPCDLSDPAARDSLVRDADALGLRVDVLVNNAGVGSGGPFVERDRESELAMVRLNCEAVVDLCHVHASRMATRRSGAILNVASTVSFQPVPRQATYSASKAMVRAFTEALHAELRGAGVSVTALCPGPARTEFIEAAGEGVSKAAASTPDFMFVPLEQVAEAGLEGLARNRRVVIPGVANRVGALSGTLTPNRVLLAAFERYYPIR